MKQFTACLQKMRNSNLAGHDDVFPEILKYAPKSVNIMLTGYFEKIIESGLVPDVWAFAIGRAVYKKGEKKFQIVIELLPLPAYCVCKLFISVITEKIEK